MPNWCEGVLKVRGSMENIRRFLLEGIDYNDYQYAPHMNEDGAVSLEETAIPREAVTKEISDNGVYITNTDELYIKDTHRMFVASDVIGSNVIRRENTSLVFIDVKQAWYIEAKELAKISSKYGVDLRVLPLSRVWSFVKKSKS